MFHTIAIHDVLPDHVEAMLAFMHRVADGVAGAPGLIDFAPYRDLQTGKLVGLARWESAEAFQQAMPQIMAFSAERRPEWTDQDDVLLALAPA
jgi:quinol monooxygenase YgiN